MRGRQNPSCPLCSRKIQKLAPSQETLKVCQTYVAEHPEEFEGATFSQIKRRKERLYAEQQVIRAALPIITQLSPKEFHREFSAYLRDEFIHLHSRILAGLTWEHRLSDFKRRILNLLNRAPLGFSQEEREDCLRKLEAAEGLIRKIYVNGPQNITVKAAKCFQAGNFPRCLRYWQEAERMAETLFDTQARLYYGDVLHLDALRLQIKDLEYRIAKKHLQLQDHLFLTARRYFYKSKNYVPFKGQWICGVYSATAVPIVQWVVYGRPFHWASLLASLTTSSISTMPLRVFQIAYPDRIREGLGWKEFTVDFLQYAVPVVSGLIVSVAILSEL